MTGESRALVHSSVHGPCTEPVHRATLTAPMPHAKQRRGRQIATAPGEKVTRARQPRTAPAVQRQTGVTAAGDKVDIPQKPVALSPLLPPAVRRSGGLPSVPRRKGALAPTTKLREEDRRLKPSHITDCGSRPSWSRRKNMTYSENSPSRRKHIIIQRT